MSLLRTLIKLSEKSCRAFSEAFYFYKNKLIELTEHPGFLIFSIILFLVLVYNFNSFCLANEQLLLDMWETSGIFYSTLFYFLVVLFSIVYASYLGSLGVYTTTGLSILASWLVQFNNLEYFLLDDGLKVVNFWQSIRVLDFIVLDFSLVFDKTSFSFLFLTTSIGLCASIYSLAYFKNEPHADRFILLLHSFILSMSLLVTADNAFIMFLGWELIGLTSFMLINFWTMRRGTIKAAFKALVFNKLSDIFILFFILLMISHTQSCSFQVWLKLFYLGEVQPHEFYTPILFLVLGSSIKSAQIIGHLWLPDSMEAPIPASALIHSATLVSAGVYLLLRMYPVVDASGFTPYLFFLGSITSFYGAIVSSAQTDAKRLLAYSTISHCGFLFVTVSIGSLNLTIIYLYLHGFFKALTFFCVGNIIKISAGYQDTRMMGQFAQLLPIESVIFVISSSNLGGLPFTVGFFYKHLFQSFLVTHTYTPYALVFLIFAMLSGIIYVFRLVYYVIFDIKKGPKINYNNSTQKALKFKDYSNTTIFSYLSVFMMLLISFYIYFIYLYWLPTNVSPAQLQNTSTLGDFGVIALGPLSIFTFFCSLLSSVFIFIFWLDCRFEFSSLNKKFTILYFITLLSLFIFFI